MGTNIKNVFVALSWLILATGCLSKSGKDTANSIGFDSAKKEISYHMMGNPEYPGCDLQISFTFPVKADNPDMPGKLQKLFVCSYFGDRYETLPPQEAAEQYVKDYLDSYKEMEDDFKEELGHDNDSLLASWYSFFEVSNNEIVYNKNGILSYTVYVEGYSGGAHGYHSTRNGNINTLTGELITEEDIFIDNFRDRLAQMIVDKIADQHNAADVKELEDKGFFSIDEIYPNGNFLIKEDGIAYLFNEYEIAAYVAGATSVFFTYRELHELLSADSPISRLYNF